MLAEGGKDLDAKPKGPNIPDAGESKSFLADHPIKSRTLAWRHGKEQFIILPTGQRKVRLVQFPGSCLGAAGCREGERA